MTFSEMNCQMTISDEDATLEYTRTAFNDKEKFIYVIDTNALIQIFQLDSDSLSVLESHFKTKRFFGTHQIEIEFLRNKDYTSNYYLVEIAKKLTDDFETNISGKLREYIKYYTHILSTEPELTKKIKRFTTTTKNILTEIRKAENQFTETKGREIISKSLKMISDNIDFKITLDAKDYSKLEKEYSDLVARNIKYYSEKKTFEKYYRAYVFPGMGEKKEINPEGDYFIFHEMIKLASEKKKNIVFLTNDTTKADWVDIKTGRNYEHYQSIFYCISKQAIKVVNFDNFLNTELGIKTERLLEVDEFDYDDEFVGRFLMKWSQFERYIREWSLKQGYQTKFNLRQIMYHAHETGKISKDLFDRFIPMNEMRNNLVHGYYVKYQSLPEVDKETILSQIEELIAIFLRDA